MVEEVQDTPASLFYATVSRRPDLAALVTSLHLRSLTKSESSEEVEASITLANIQVAVLACCVNVSHLFLQDMSRASKVLLLRAIHQCKRLRTLSSRDTCHVYSMSLTIADYDEIRRHCTDLEVVSLSNAAHDDPVITHLPDCPMRIKRIDLDSMYMSDTQFIALMTSLAPTLESLRIDHEVDNITYGRDWYSYDALVKGLGMLRQLAHLYLHRNQSYGHIVYDSTSPALLESLKQLRTLYITPDTFPYSGLGHLCSTKLEGIHLAVRSGITYPAVDGTQIAAGVRDMLARPATCPMRLSIDHEITHYDDPEDPVVEDAAVRQPVDADTISALTDLCAAAGVRFQYYSYHRVIPVQPEEEDESDPDSDEASDESLIGHVDGTDINNGDE